MSDRTAPSELWQTARWLLETLFSLYGEPQHIAACGAVNAKTYRWLTTWLRAGEALLRRLVLLEARALSAPAPPPVSGAKSGQGVQRKSAPFSLNPDDWRVSFSSAVNTDRRRPRRPTPAPAGETPAVHNALPLARRAEALLRVFNHPLRYAHRLARQIARAPAHIARMLAPPHRPKRKSGDPPHIVDIIGRETWARLENAFETAAPNSS